MSEIPSQIVNREYELTNGTKLAAIEMDSWSIKPKNVLAAIRDAAPLVDIILTPQYCLYREDQWITFHENGQKYTIAQTGSPEIEQIMRLIQAEAAVYQTNICIGSVCEKVGEQFVSTTLFINGQGSITRKIRPDASTEAYKDHVSDTDRNKAPFQLPGPIEPIRVQTKAGHITIAILPGNDLYSQPIAGSLDKEKIDLVLAPLCEGEVDWATYDRFKPGWNISAFPGKILICDGAKSPTTFSSRPSYAPS